MVQCKAALVWIEPFIEDVGIHISRGYVKAAMQLVVAMPQETVGRLGAGNTCSLIVRCV